MNEQPESAELKEIPEDLIPQEPVKGDKVTAHVVETGEEGYLVGIGTKTEAWLPGRELGSAGREAGEGDALEVELIRRDPRRGRWVVSRRKVEETHSWAECEKAHAEEAPVEGRILRATKGGVHVDVGGVTGFMPRSLLDSRPPAQLETLVGKTVTALVQEIEPGRNLVLSRVAWQKRERAKAFDSFAAKHGPGDKVSARVARLMTRKGQKRPFAALLDADGTELFLHEEEASWERVPLDKLLAQGQIVEVAIVAIDPDNERVRASLKATQPDPWQNESLVRGAWLDGEIRNVTKFGAFVHVGHGVEGLVHHSEVSADMKVDHNKVLKKGQQVKVRVISCDPIKRRLALTLLTEEEAARPRGETFGDDYEGGASLLDRLGD